MSKSKYVITVNRQFGSMGRPIAKLLAEKLQIGYYDRDLIDEAADYLGIVSGHDEPNKIEKAGLHTVKSEFVDAPVIEEFPITLECKVEEIKQYDQTLRIVAEIVNVLVDDSVLGDGDVIDTDKLEAISLAPSSHKYVKIGGDVADAFSCGNALK